MNRDHALSGVHCDVANCSYNEAAKRCHAQHIQVANQTRSSNSKIDTFCGTFQAKSQSEPQGRH